MKYAICLYTHATLQSSFWFSVGGQLYVSWEGQTPNLLTNQALIVVDNLILNKFHTIGYFTPIINNFVFVHRHDFYLAAFSVKYFAYFRLVQCINQRVCHRLVWSQVIGAHMWRILRCFDYSALLWRVDDLRSPAGWLPVHRDQLRTQRSVSRMGSLYLFIVTSSIIVHVREILVH